MGGKAPRKQLAIVGGGKPLPEQAQNDRRRNQQAQHDLQRHVAAFWQNVDHTRYAQNDAFKTWVVTNGAMEVECVRAWNGHARQYGVDKSVKQYNVRNEYARREFCNGLSSDQLADAVDQDPNMEFKTPEEYRAEQTERDPHKTARPALRWPNVHLAQRTRQQPDDLLNAGPTDRSVGWASLASWYYPRHEGVIRECWEAYGDFKQRTREHDPLKKERTIKSTQVVPGVVPEPPEPFVKTATYRQLQDMSDTLDVTRAPERYKSIYDGLRVVALFLGNGPGGEAYDRFKAARDADLGARRLAVLKHNQSDVPAYRTAATPAERYVPLKQFLDFVFATRPVEGGGANYDNGINPNWSQDRFDKREGAQAARRDFKGDDGYEDDEARVQRAFTAWVATRKAELDLTLRVMGGLAIPWRSGAYASEEHPVANALLDRLWDFLIEHAWPVYARHVQLKEGAPFAAIETHHPLWFRATHYDEYDRWAHDKWRMTSAYDAAFPFSFENRRDAMPDLYTLMKRRHKTVIEADECRERVLTRGSDEADDNTYESETWARTGEVVRNVHKPRSGGKSYGAGAYRALRYDPYCTFGRQRKRPAGERPHGTEKTALLQARLIPEAEEAFTDWDALMRAFDQNGCHPCGAAPLRDRLPTPWHPARPSYLGNDDDSDDSDDGDDGDGGARPQSGPSKGKASARRAIAKPRKGGRKKRVLRMGPADDTFGAQCSVRDD
jgi:hypothetical protein